MKCALPFDEALGKVKDGTAPPVLDLSRQSIGATQAIKLAKALHSNSSVTALSLAHNQIGNEGVKALSDFLKKNKSITRIDLRDNGIGLEGVTEFLHALLVNVWLVEVRVKENPTNLLNNFPHMNVSMFGKAVRDIKRLEEANIKFQRVIAGKSDEMDLSGRCQTELNVNIINKFPNLLILNISRNKIKEIPEEIGELKLLEVLNVSYNRISRLPDAIAQLERLRILDLRFNLLGGLPRSLAKIKSLEIVEYFGNKEQRTPPKEDNPLDYITKMPESAPKQDLITIPNEVVERKGKPDVIAYMREIQRPKTQYRLKIMTLGPKGVGKTSLLGNLFKDAEGEGAKAPVAPTKGVVREWLELKTPAVPRTHNNTLIVCTYDPGGDCTCTDLFLTSRTVYLVVFNIMHPEEEKSRVRHWLKRISKLVKAPVPVVIVGTFEDDKGATRPYKRKLFQSMVAELGPTYRGLKHLCAVSNDTKKGITELRERILSLAPGYGWLPQEMPRAYLSLEVAASSKTFQLPQPIMNEESFIRLGIKCKLRRDTVLPAARFIEGLGVVKCCPPLVLLSPEWVSRILDQPDPSEKKTSEQEQKPLTLASDADIHKELNSLLGEVKGLNAEFALLRALVKSRVYLGGEE